MKHSGKPLFPLSDLRIRNRTQQNTMGLFHYYSSGPLPVFCVVLCLISVAAAASTGTIVPPASSAFAGEPITPSFKEPSKIRMPASFVNTDGVSEAASVNRSMLKHTISSLRKKGFTAVAGAMAVRRTTLLSHLSITIFAVSDKNLFLKTEGFSFDLNHHVAPRRYLFQDLLGLSTEIETLAVNKSLLVVSVNSGVTINGLVVKDKEIYINKWVSVLAIPMSLDDVLVSPTETKQSNKNSSGRDEAKEVKTIAYHVVDWISRNWISILSAVVSISGIAYAIKSRNLAVVPLINTLIGTLVGNSVAIPALEPRLAEPIPNTLQVLTPASLPVQQSSPPASVNYPATPIPMLPHSAPLAVPESAIPVPSANAYYDSPIQGYGSDSRVLQYS